MHNVFNNNDIMNQIMDELDSKGESAKIHLRIKQRTGRKNFTFVENLHEDIDKKEFVKRVKKQFCCNGAILENEADDTEVIQFQGDHRKSIKELLINHYKVDGSVIIVHGHGG